MIYLIILTPIKSYDEGKYNVVRCQTCKHRLCDKPIKSKVSIFMLEGDQTEILNHLLLFCRKCKTKYLVSIEK